METRACKENVHKVGARKEGSRRRMNVAKKEENLKWYEYEK